MKISRLALGNLETKWHLGAGPMARHKVYCKGEGGDFPQVRAMVNFVSLCLLMALPCTKVFQLRTNQLVGWFVQVRVNNWCLSLFLVPILQLQHAVLPPKCCELGSVPQLLLFHCLRFKLTFEFIKELGGASKDCFFSLLLCFFLVLSFSFRFCWVSR